MKKLLPILFLGLFSLIVQASSLEKNELTFERLTMSRDTDYGSNNKVEGYWAYSRDPKEDYYKGKYPFPIAHDTPWRSQAEFMQKLAIIEANAEIIGYRGLAHSRFHPKYNVGSREFACQDYKTGENIHWPEGYREYYVGKFNVKPSKEFYDLVMNDRLKK